MQSNHNQLVSLDELCNRITTHQNIFTEVNYKDRLLAADVMQSVGVDCVARL